MKISEEDYDTVKVDLGGVTMCPECGSTKQPKVYTTNECTDADGNRGIKIRWVECVDCYYEEGTPA